MREPLNIGFAMCGSYCTFDAVIPQIMALVDKGYNVIPIFSDNAYKTDTKFGKAKDFVDTVEKICDKKVIKSINEAEPIGSKGLLDILVIAPVTGNTLAKLALGITDTSVTMAAKAHLRNQRPVLLGISSNDALGANAKNIGALINTKHIFIVPYKQDDPLKKTSSLVSDMKLIEPAIFFALENKQMQPILL